MQKLLLGEDGFFYLSGKLKERDFSKYNFLHLVENLLSKSDFLGKQYFNYMSNDDKLVGQEKANLELILENITDSLVTIRLYLAYLYSNKKRLIEAEYFEKKFQFKITLKDYDYSISGKLSQKLFLEIDHFHDWYKSHFIPHLKEFTDEIKDSFADRELNEKEVESINEKLDPLLHLIIIIKFKLEHLDMPS